MVIVSCWMDRALAKLHSVWNLPKKSGIQYCERSELRLNFEWTKVYQNSQKKVNSVSSWTIEASGQKNGGKCQNWKIKMRHTLSFWSLGNQCFKLVIFSGNAAIGRSSRSRLSGNEGNSAHQIYLSLLRSLLLTWFWMPALSLVLLASGEKSCCRCRWKGAIFERD